MNNNNLPESEVPSESLQKPAALAPISPFMEAVKHLPVIKDVMVEGDPHKIGDMFLLGRRLKEFSATVDGEIKAYLLKGKTLPTAGLQERAGSWSIKDPLEAFRRSELSAEEFLSTVKTVDLDGLAEVLSLKKSGANLKSEDAMEPLRQILGDTLVQSKSSKALVEVNAHIPTVSATVPVIPAVVPTRQASLPTPAPSVVPSPSPTLPQAPTNKVIVRRPKAVTKSSEADKSPTLNLF